MSNADTLRRVLVLMDEQNVPAIRELLAPDFRAVVGGTPPMGADEWAAMVEMMYVAFPDGKHAVDEILEVDDRVVLRGRFAGTHEGDFMGIAPTGKEITISFVNIDRYRDGRFVERLAEIDMLGLMQQLGAATGAAPDASSA